MTATDVLPDRQTCTKCGRTKPLTAFTAPPSGRRHSWCRSCVRVGVALYHRTERYREWLAAYRAREDVRERRREYERRRRDSRKAQAKAYRATPKGKLLHCRNAARARLARATDERRRQRLTELIAQYDREIARIDAGLNGDALPTNALLTGGKRRGPAR